ncbi:MAG: ATP-binding cassette domain-containing protein [Burkholderiales bacterium]|nr:ATP-binding cassette domain-containing protein [Burkholderiales bacterium]
MSDALLDVSDLRVHFPLRRATPFAPKRTVKAVDGVSFALAKGRTFGIVGESGSGKTTTALAVMRLTEITSGAVRLGDESLSALEGEALRRARRRVQMIFQDPYSSLNPRMRAGAIVAEPMELMQVGTETECRERAQELFAQVGLRSDQLQLFPHQFSGGQRQRIGIARALATKPELVVCDEPVSALDVAIQAQILNLLVKLQEEYGLAYLFISHDLGVVQYLCDEVAVMYLGRMVEQAPREALFGNPLHPYTWALLSAVPRVGRRRRDGAARLRLEGDPPSPISPPPGCRFSSRCPYAEARCKAEEPVLREVRPGHRVACHLVREDGTAPLRPATL